MPAKAGFFIRLNVLKLDARLRGNDE